MKLTSPTFCLCSTLLIVAVNAAATPKSTPDDAKVSSDVKAADAKSTVTSSVSSSSSTSSKTAPSGAASKTDAAKASAKTVTTTGKPASPVSDDQLDKLLLDRRYLSRQLKCALGEGVCDPVGRRLKSFAPLVLRGNCPQCTPTETRQIQKVLSHVQRNYPKEWAKIIQQFTGN